MQADGGDELAVAGTEERRDLRVEGDGVPRQALEQRGTTEERPHDAEADSNDARALEREERHDGCDPKRERAERERLLLHVERETSEHRERSGQEEDRLPE